MSGKTTKRQEFRPAVYYFPELVLIVTLFYSYIVALASCSGIYTCAHMHIYEYIYTIIHVYIRIYIYIHL